MLVLTRKLGEAIEIDGGVVIWLLEVTSRASARIGIEAPPEIGIRRRELAPKPD